MALRSHIAVRPPEDAAADPAALHLPAEAWKTPTLSEDDLHREGYALLGLAWRSNIATPIRTGHRFAALSVPQKHGAPALDHLRRLGAPCGAVTAAGDAWTFFVPADSGCIPWPSSATYLCGPEVWVPPRGARSGEPGLRWITRAFGQLLTAPLWLWSALVALAEPANGEGGPSRSATAPDG